MTIKTISQSSNTNIVVKQSDMQKRGAVRNLFGTTVDRDELQKQLAQSENESYQTLQQYHCDSIIGVIQRDDEDQARKLKRLPQCLESDDESDDESQTCEPTREHPSNDEAIASNDEASASNDEAPTSNDEAPTSNDEASTSGDQSASSSSNKTDTANIPQRIPPSLPRGQRTLKGELVITFKS